MTRWPTSRLADLCQDITVGHVGKMSDRYEKSGIPFLRSQDIEPNRINLSTIKFIPKDFHRDLRKSRLRPGDVVMVRTGYPGTAAVIPPELEDSNCADLVIARPGPRLDPHFLAYSMNSPWGKGVVGGSLVGVAQQHFNVKVAANVQLPFPPLPIQRRIASILGAYDDLIEVNRRRIALLEEMARRLFDEWFVHFRFPGHEGHEMVETENGTLPQGWASCRLNQLALVNDRSVKPDRAPSEIQYLDIASVSPGRIDAIQTMLFTDAPGRARRLVKDGSVIWSTVRPNRRSFAIILDPPDNLIVSTGFAVLDALKVPFSYLYLAVTSDAFVSYLTNHATGSAYPAVTGSTFEAAQLILPSKPLLDAFHKVAEPLIRLAGQLEIANKGLAASRDLLLPRLISGDLQVSAAEAELENAA